MVAPAYYGGRGTEGTRWFVPGADRCLPWGRDGGASAAAGSSETLVAVMARRAPAPSVILQDAMRTAEAAACEVVLCVHPTKEAEQHRQDVIGYLKRLIGSSVGCEVIAFGSVPLRTYLPDGDVDITVLGNTWLNSTFIDDVRSVKLMKCVIENIVVDVSFNQIGGVSTFCFLELALYWFLEYFSKFDWDKYGISLNGLIELSSLPNLTVEPTTGHDELLLDQEFLQGFLDRLVFPNESDGCDAQFRQKFLNIVDPLKGNNNLGRSVSKG
nr:unnamed protein product [Digitaria exilis]